MFQIKVPIFNGKRVFKYLSACRKQSTSTNKLVVVEDRGPVRLIGINRPEKRNCVNRETAIQLNDAFDQFDKNDKMKVAVLHGIGGTFCAGYDLSELSNIDSMNMSDIEENLDKIIQKGPMVCNFTSVRKCNLIFNFRVHPRCLFLNL